MTIDSLASQAAPPRVLLDQDGRTIAAAVVPGTDEEL